MPHIYIHIVVGHRNMLRWNCEPSRMHNTWTCAYHKAHNPVVAHSHIYCATTFQSLALFSKKTKVNQKECLIYIYIGCWTGICYDGTVSQVGCKRPGLVH